MIGIHFGPHHKSETAWLWHVRWKLLITLYMTKNSSMSISFLELGLVDHRIARIEDHLSVVMSLQIREDVIQLLQMAMARQRQVLR